MIKSRESAVTITTISNKFHYVIADEGRTSNRCGKNYEATPSPPIRLVHKPIKNSCLPNGNIDSEMKTA